MDDEITVRVDLLFGDDGMIGRECPACRKYFKVKPGTGLPNSSSLTCPYCENTKDSNEFLTQAQLDYIQSIALHDILGPSLRELQKSFKDLERSTRNSLFSIKVDTKGFDLPIEYYTEKDLETPITCDNCGLEFAVFGIFATCPDCVRLTAMSMFSKSIEAARRRLDLLRKIPSNESDIRNAIIVDTLSATVSTFDSLGKRLQGEFPVVLPERPRNLFQNLDALSEVLLKNASINLSQLVEGGSFAKIYYLFQVRHIWAHNFGEADEEFIRKTGVGRSLFRTRITLSQAQIEEFLTMVESLGISLRRRLQQGA